MKTKEEILKEIQRLEKLKETALHYALEGDNWHTADDAYRAAREYNENIKTLKWVLGTN